MITATARQAAWVLEGRQRERVEVGGRVVALLPTKESATLAAEGLTTTGAILSRRRRADGTVEAVDLGK